jgi:PAS domain S-box-containing protein
MRLTPQQKIAAAFISAAGISIVIGVLAYWSASRMRHAAVLLAQSQQVVSALESIFRIDDELSTTERDYVLTGNDAYLTAYRHAVAGEGAAIRRARELTADNPSQRRRLELVSTLIGQFEAFTARVLRVRRVHGVPPAAELVLSGTEESLQHAINTNVAAIIGQEHRHLAERQLQMTRASDTALELILAGSGLAVLIGLVASIRIRGDFRALEQAEERFRALMDSAPDAMAVVDGKGDIVLVNTRTESLFEYKRQELIGKPIDILIPERYRARHAAHRGIYAESPVPRAMGANLELFARRRDGSEIPVEVSLSPVATSGGLRVVSAIRDISDRKRALEQLRHARAAAEKADRAKSTFLATASHDLRQPLQTLSLLNGTLRRMGKDSDPAEALSLQEAAIGVMSRLLDALLDISKLESGAVKPVVTNWQAVSLFGQLRAEFANIAADKGVQLEAERSPAWVRSDVSLVGQVLRNLVSNAIKYTHRGSVRLRVRPEGEAVWVEVTDTGIGMAPEELSHIYEEFYQIGVPKNATREGYGLGLSIVSRIVKLLGLELDVHSEIGKGSTFALKLPVGTAIVASTAPLGVTSAAERSAKSVHRILVVEDDPAVLNATRLLLTVEGYGVATATSVAQALERMHESPDLELVMTDYHLVDGETGRQVIASVRQLRGPDFKAILITGDTSRAARAVDGDENLHFLSKPVEPEQLLRLLKKLLVPRASLPEKA